MKKITKLGIVRFRIKRWILKRLFSELQLDQITQAVYRARIEADKKMCQPKELITDRDYCDSHNYNNLLGYFGKTVKFDK